MQLGPRCQTLFADPTWQPSTGYQPHHQCYADELERLLDFAFVHGQLDRYRSKLCARERDSHVAELRVAYDLADRGFRFEEFEPLGVDDKLGEFLVYVPSQTASIFTEVKAPRWNAEVTRFGEGASEPQSLQAAKKRMNEPKYRNGGGGASPPGVGVEFEIQKAYEKLPSDRPTLVVVHSNYLFDSYQHSPEIIKRGRLLQTGGPFDSDKFERLGGVGLFWYEDRAGAIVYDMEVVINPHATRANALPTAAQHLLHQRLPKERMLSPLQMHAPSARP